jgi:predicted ribosomally synthesized peptide with SipW-like signal peptide
LTDALESGNVNASSHRGWRSRRVRALLAGGMVLGAGAAITMAAWNDSEFAQGNFAAGSFNLVGSTDGLAFSDHASAGSAAPLSFTLNAATLSPGDVVYAPFAVELDATTTSDAIAAITNAASTGTVSNLTYSLLQTTTFDCSSATIGATLVPAGTAVGVVPASTTFNLTKSVNGVDPGAPVHLCFAVTAGSGIAQGQMGTSTWRFTAASQ